MAEPHLAHRLPWNSLADMLTSNPSHQHVTAKDEHVVKRYKRIEHFARCLTDALNEFAASDRSSDRERVEFDPSRSWDADCTSHGGYMGYLDSIIYGYIELNLILTDATKLAPLILRGPDLQRTWVLDVLCGDCDGGHPAWLADHIRPIFDERRRLKPLTAAVCQRIRDHCALLFRCMHTLSDSNVFLDPEHVARELQSFLEQRR